MYDTDMVWDQFPVDIQMQRSPGTFTSPAVSHHLHSTLALCLDVYIQATAITVSKSGFLRTRYQVHATAHRYEYSLSTSYICYHLQYTSDIPGILVKKES